MNVHLSEFACEAVAGKDREADQVSEMVARAIRCYVGSRGSSGAGWSYPSFAQPDGRASAVELQLSVDEDNWRLLEEEAEKQGVSTEDMVTHATLWFAAEMDAGRATQRIVEGLDDGPGKETNAG